MGVPGIHKAGLPNNIDSQKQKLPGHGQTCLRKRRGIPQNVPKLSGLSLDQQSYSVSRLSSRALRLGLSLQTCSQGWWIDALGGLGAAWHEPKRCRMRILPHGARVKRTIACRLPAQTCSCHVTFFGVLSFGLCIWLLALAFWRHLSALLNRPMHVAACQFLVEGSKNTRKYFHVTCKLARLRRLGEAAASFLDLKTKGWGGGGGRGAALTQLLKQLP